MLFQSHAEDAGVVLRAFQDRVCKTLKGVHGFPVEESVRIGEGGYFYERDFTPHKSTFLVGLRLVDAEQGPHIDVTLVLYRIITGGLRRPVVSLSVRGKPLADRSMIWPSFVERQRSRTPPPPVQHLIRRFQGIGRMKGLDGEMVADERIHLLANYALRGAKSLV